MISFNKIKKIIFLELWNLHYIPQDIFKRYRNFLLFNPNFKWEYECLILILNSGKEYNTLFLNSEKDPYNRI